MAEVKEMDFELSPMPGEELLADEPNPLDVPTEASFDDVEQQPVGQPTTVDVSHLTEQEQQVFDPSNPAHAAIIEELRQSRAAQFDVQQPQAQEPTDLPEIEFGFRPVLEVPEEFEPYMETVFSGMEQYAKKLFADMDARATAIQQHSQSQEVERRLVHEAQGVLNGPHRAELMPDRMEILSMADTEAGKTLLADPTFGFKGLVNAVRAQKGKAPLNFNGQAAPAQPFQRQAVQRLHPSQVQAARASAVEQTPPSVDQSQPAAPSQVPGRKLSTRELVKQAWAESRSDQVNRRG